MDRNDAELDSDCYFVQDLISLKAVDSRTGEEYGIITNVTETGANDVYHIKTDGGKMYYIPAIPDVVKDIDIENGIMKIIPLDGLFD